MGVGAGGVNTACDNSDTQEILRQGPRMASPLRILLVTQEQEGSHGKSLAANGRTSGTLSLGAPGSTRRS